VVLVQIPELMRYIFGPLPTAVCICQLWVKNVTFLNAMLFYDAIIVTNYIFIFWLKNPAAFKDDYWNIFLNKWVLGVSSISQLVFMLVPGNQPLNFFICTGLNPIIQLKNKINYTIVIVQVSILFMFYMCIFLRK